VIVVDASVAVKWFVFEEGHLSAVGLLEQNQVLVAPDLIFSETANVLWKKLRKGEVTVDQAEAACRALPDFFQGVISSSWLSAEAVAFANRLNHSVYDCIYLACSEQLAAKLVTADKRFVSRIRNADLSHLVVDLDDVSGLVQSTGGALSISEAELTRVLGLSDQFDRTMKFVEEQVGKPLGGGTTKWVDSADLRPALDSPNHQLLRQALNGLSRDNLRDIVALAWLGRGHDGTDWMTLRTGAEGLLGSRPLEHEGYIVSLLSYVQEGIETLRKTKPDQTNPNAK
jgi:predicted nucleic acid-binding protein